MSKSEGCFNLRRKTIWEGNEKHTICPNQKSITGNIETFSLNAPCVHMYKSQIIQFHLWSCDKHKHPLTTKTKQHNVTSKLPFYKLLIWLKKPHLNCSIGHTNFLKLLQLSFLHKLLHQNHAMPLNFWNSPKKQSGSSHILGGRSTRRENKIFFTLKRGPKSTLEYLHSSMPTLRT